MYKNLILLIFLLPLNCLAQFSISGNVVNANDKTPIPNASVFLSSTSTGDKTNADGAFILNNIKPGKYQLVVSIVGFESYSQTVIVSGNSILPAIALLPKQIVLEEVKIKFKRDPYRARNYDWFKREFLGTSYLAADCNILNPDILDLNYNEDTKVLTASSSDFLIIENAALGYRVRYLVNNFTMNNPGELTTTVHYEGSVLFENMQAPSTQLNKWQNRRQQVYEGSEMHFLRSVVDNRIKEEGFRVLPLITYTKPGSTKIHQRLVDPALTKGDIVQATNQPGVYALGYHGAALHISYSKVHHFYKPRISNLNSVNNPDQTLLIFNKPQVLFDKNGIVLFPDDLSFSGAWGHDRVAELLPVDYEPSQQNTTTAGTGTRAASDRLTNFLAKHVAEKTYLHFDKPYYAAGDTLYFKAYVTLGADNRPSDLSGVLHVDLINTGDKIDQSVKLKVTNGVSWGDFALPDSLPKGNYRVRAYTQWMLNDNVYFEQDIPVGTINNNRIPESNTAKTAVTGPKPDMQFFPEAGGMVVGIRSKMAFKAVAGNGLGIDVKGTVVDDENKEVANFASVHNGMGDFYLTPLAGKSYKARFTYADGTQASADLPKADNDGIVLSINNDSIPKATVKIEATKRYYQLNKNKIYSLVISSGGVINTLDIRLDSTTVSMDVLKRRLHTGIATVTLFSPKGEPLCERLFFVQNYDQLNIALSSNKASYSKREKTNLNLTVKNRAGENAKGHFSVSVVNEDIVPSDENAEHTILTDLLLTSDLKGYIEQPNYYFTNITAKILANLDLVMLTNGYRRFEWKQVLADDNQPLKYQQEKGLEISGIAQNLLGKPLAKAAVSLIAKRDGKFSSTSTDELGHFKFTNLDFADSTKFILQAVNAKGKNDTKLVFDSNNTVPVVLPAAAKNNVPSQLIPYLENDRKLQKEEAEAGVIKGKLLKTVVVKDRKIENIPLSATRMVSPEFADQVIKPEDMAKGGLFADQVRGAFRGIVIMRDFNGSEYAVAAPGHSPKEHMAVILDGVTTDGDLNELTGIEIEDIEVLKSASRDIYGPMAANGLLVINSKKNLGVQAKDLVSTGILPIYPKGFYKAREFYAPKYNHIDPANNHADLRSTVYWQPETTTGDDGSARLDYYNADTPGTYRVTVQGIDENGNLGVQVYRYVVK